jgi:RNA polymerase sigma factor (sigma-70 family)
LNAITKLLAAAGYRDLDDATLLARFAAERDAAAFEVLVWRHGGLVRGVCRHYLRDPNDIDDVTQAAFLALARKARSVRSAGPWLARVATHAARRLRRANAARAARHAATVADVPAREPLFDDGWRHVLTEEIARLPDRYRVVVRRCYLDGLSTSEAAREFGWARGTVLTRLAWAKARLRQRLTSRGVVLGAGGVAGLLFQLAAGPVTRAAARDILRAVAGAPGWRVTRLTDGVLIAMFWTRVKFATGIALVCGAALVGAAVSKSGSQTGTQGPAMAAAQPRASQLAEVIAAAGAIDVEKLQKEPATGRPGAPVKTKPGAGPGFGFGTGDGAKPAPASPVKTKGSPGGPGAPVKTKPGAGPGSGSGGPPAP